ncbi:hypothetical protein PC129_g15928 [Phytophthora cactorum]|uniref:Uncharacterized protein n=2 Tax=Phytophthora cactorum TaxID=29920 RepID=A0A8T1HLX9_9STRA|nr:hypothetical protein Pcac1_g4496 [Phytophthora cactorum]KAG2809561.1 hypothetical protein PC111_g16005 [Phytophthora cactorum]KAG2809572.1 hypothetical protein PC112_g16447 [Phytophthora cactorum]KAG2852725.1 hypothetical protein PC113_g14778 [Phytophthora cactorum]KAG2894097.1 hypothetical protein PC114_g16031 [Phytophthora cactorum]
MATKRAPASNAASTGRKKSEEGEGGASDQELEDKVTPPKPKRSKKASTSTEAMTAVQLPPPNYPETASISRQVFDLPWFMQSFEPERAMVAASAPTADPHAEE